MNIKNIFARLIGSGWLGGNTRAATSTSPVKALENKRDDLKLVSVKIPARTILDLKQFNSFLSKHLFSTIPYTNYRVKVFSNHSNLSKYEQCIEGDLRSVDKLSFERGSKYPTMRLNILINGYPAQVQYFIGPQKELPDSLSVKQIKRIEIVDKGYSIFFPEDKDYASLIINTPSNREVVDLYGR